MAPKCAKNSPKGPKFNKNGRKYIVQMLRIVQWFMNIFQTKIRAHWKLTETDGQLGIADAIITNFYYTKSVMRDDSVEHLFEIGYLNVKNCLPGQLYSEVIYPTELSKDVPLDRHRTLRVFCR